MDPEDIQKLGWVDEALAHFGKHRNIATFTRNYHVAIHLAKETLDRESLATVVAYVVKMGPLCFSDQNKFGDTPWCQEKQWVIFARYAGSRFKIEGGEVRILNDDEI